MRSCSADSTALAPPPNSCFSASRADQAWSPPALLPLKVLVTQPSLPWRTSTRRAARLSFSGALSIASPFLRPKLPNCRLSEASRSFSGSWLMIEMAPAALLRPNRVPCGPLITSMRATSTKFIRAPPVLPV